MKFNLLFSSPKIYLILLIFMRYLKTTTTSTIPIPDIEDDIEEKEFQFDPKREKGISFFGGFGISKPKPWRKDDDKSKLLNYNSEIVVNPDNPKSKPLPTVSSRSDSPALKLLSPKGCGESDVKNMRVVNGKDAQLGAYPWMVVVLKEGDAWCGGSILNEKWILTAAHCFMSDVNAKLYAVRVGTIDRNMGTTYKVDKVIVHERFHLDNMFNSDIALLHVNRPIKMGKLVKTVCIQKKNYEDILTEKLLVTGWGQTSYTDKELPKNLQEVLLNVVKPGDCAKKYKSKGNNIYYSQICTWNKGQDACQGDSGAPAIEYRSDIAYQVGIVSYGSTCADEMPGVYTRVSYFLDWMLRVLAKEEGLSSVKYYSNYFSKSEDRKPVLYRRRGTSNYYYFDQDDISEFERRKYGRITNGVNNLRFYDFKTSKPKPWRRDDEVYARSNRAAEVPADPYDTELEMKGQVKMPGRILADRQKKKKKNVDGR